MSHSRIARSFPAAMDSDVNLATLCHSKVLLRVRATHRHDPLRQRRIRSRQRDQPLFAVAHGIRLEIVEQKLVRRRHASRFAFAVVAGVLARDRPTRRHVLQLRDHDPRRHVRQHRAHEFARAALGRDASERARGDEHLFVVVQAAAARGPTRARATRRRRRARGGARDAIVAVIVVIGGARGRGRAARGRGRGLCGTRRRTPGLP